jgi:hypothetical protein
MSIKKVIVILMMVHLFLMSSLNGVVFSTSNLGDIQIPSVPEFTVRYVDLSYDIPTTYEIDQFTGKNVTKQEGYHVDKRSIVFKIKNQPFISYNDASGNEIGLYYNFRFKGHFGGEWRHYPFSESGQGTRRYSAMFYVLTYESPKLAASNSEFTNITLSIPFLYGIDNPKSGSIDFQVQTLVGHIDYAGDGFYKFEGQRSDWSNTQTMTIGEITQNADSIPEFSSLNIVPIFIVSILAIIVIRNRFQRKKLE